MRAVLLFLLFALLSSTASAQSKKSINDVRNIFDEKGDYYFDRKEYKKAIVYFNMAHDTDEKNFYAVLRKAEAYQKMELYDQAAQAYEIIFDTDLYIPNEFRMKYALLLLKNKDITGFEKWMSLYNDEVHSEIHNYLNAQDVRAKMYKDSSFVILENENILNSAESDIAPAVIDGQVVFASKRKNLVGGSGDNFNFYSATYLDDGHLGKLNVYNSKINTSSNEVAIALNSKENKIYFTRGSSHRSGLQSFKSTVPAGPNSAVDVNPLSVGGMKVIGQPAFNSKGNKMYFASDAAGGAGGLDIYSSEMSGGIWSPPVSLGNKVNTAADEMYPAIVGDTALYFTSGGHNTMGGFDLFVINLKRGNSTAQNLGSQVNSKFNDYGLSFSNSGLTGYFCSDRPGGFGKEDIYRVHILDLKVKLAAYKFKRKPTIEDDKINLYLSDGEEYNISSDDNTGFNFTFKPEEGYKMVIRHENPLASNIIYDTKLSEAQKKNKFLDPEPFQKTEIKLQPGMKYQFTAGMKPISEDYKAALNAMSQDYQNTSSTIDLTALAKELLLKEGEVYTIRFERDELYDPDAKSKEESTLSINENTVPVQDRSFFIMLPLDIEANFNIKTDLVHFKETYNPKKVGQVKVDAEPVLKEEQVKESDGFPILVNTNDFGQVGKRKIKATELTIVPGSMYILSVATKETLGKDSQLEVTIPLTKGVKYNLGTEAESEAEYNKTLSQMASNQGTGSNEELIDISILSKELDVFSEDEIAFSLIPAPTLGAQASDGKNVLTTLNVDGRKYFMTTMQRVQVDLKLDKSQKVNIQTDLNYVKENFVPSTIKMNVDTTSINKNIEEKKKSIITDPVFDVITVNFNLNDYSIRPDAKTILAEKVIEVLKNDSRIYVTIKGYTDPLGDAAYNEKLSRNRAQTVKDFLSNNGIGENRIRTFSYGETQSLAAGTDWKDLSEEELKKHRKVEIVMYLPK